MVAFFTTPGRTDDGISIRLNRGWNLYPDDNRGLSEKGTEMIIAFILSMPNIGRWEGSENLYVRTHSFTTKKEKEKVRELLKTGYFHYNFGDGWAVGVSLDEVNAQEASKLRKASNGFCGYEWMIDSIIDHGYIRGMPI